mgnify:CR=1 FL=1
MKPYRVMHTPPMTQPGMAAWRTENRLQIFVQIIDRYFGNATMNFTFIGDMATVNMEKTAEDFLEEYQGEAVAKLRIAE